MANTIVGLFDDRDEAQNAVRDLVEAGFARDRVSIVANDPQGNLQTEKVDEQGNFAGAGAATGAASGAVVGGIAGLLIGMGFAVIPVAGLLIAGPIAGLVAGVVGGAAAGGIIGALIGLGIPREQADVYAEAVRRGSTLVTVQTFAEADRDRAEQILDRDGAVDIEQRAEAYRQEGFTAYDPKQRPFSREEAEQERLRRGQTAVRHHRVRAYETPATTQPAVVDPALSASANAVQPTNPVVPPSNEVASVDSWFRQDFAQRFAKERYEDYEPAYRFGYQLATDPHYANVDWNALEPLAMQRWESVNPSSWNRFRDVVYAAWQQAAVRSGRATIM